MSRPTSHSSEKPDASRLQLNVTPTAEGRVVELETPAGVLTVQPLRIRLLSGACVVCGYEQVDTDGDAIIGRAHRERAGVEIEAEDRWESTGDEVSVTRRVRAHGGAADEALAVALQVALPGRSWRWFVPGNVYSPSQYGDRRRAFADHRTSLPLAAAFDPELELGITLARTTYAAFDARADRRAGESHYRQATDIGSVGFDPGEHPALHASWPYAEEDTSAMLDAAGSPALAFHPLGPEGLSVTLGYTLTVRPSRTFAAMAWSSYRAAWVSRPASRRPKCYTLRESVDFRAQSMAKTYCEWGESGAGFLLSFDPERGYEHEPKAFGSSFVEHGMTGSHRILEYGFTGRQLDVALFLTRTMGGPWVDRAKRVIEHFVERMTTPSGWMWTIWDIDRDSPLYSCGDPSGPVMHYLGEASAPGAHTRMMVEAAGDLLAHHRFAGGWKCLEPCQHFGDFLIRAQESDGSWYRAYTPDGAALHSQWLGQPGHDGKAATSVAVPYLLALADLLGPDAGARYRRSAEHAGAYVLEHQVAHDDYRGGTLDNPNVVDKEAALLAMRAMLCLHEATGEGDYLEAAVRAAGVAITWHSAWDVPLLEGTPVAAAGVQSPGWGGINDVWGAGVTDIYTLFYLRDLQRLAARIDDSVLARICATIAWSSTDLLADPHERFGLADVGMQPEGIAFCDQGADDDVIRKGDRWGGLAWPYSAGTTALSDYLDEVEAVPAPPPVRDHRRGVAPSAQSS